MTSPPGTLTFPVFDGIGLNITNLRVVSTPPARITFPRMFANAQVIPHCATQCARRP